METPHDRMKEVDKLRKTGMSVQKSCEQAHISVGTYYEYKRKKPGKRKSTKPTITEIPVQDMNSGRLVVIIGQAADVMTAVRTLQ